MKKKSLQSHLFEPPGRSTGNRIIFMDSLKLLTSTRQDYFFFWSWVMTLVRLRLKIEIISACLLK